MSVLLFSFLTPIAVLAQTYTINTIAGGALPENVQGTSAVLGATNGIAADAAGNVYIPLADYHIVVKLDTSGNLTRIAGTGFAGFSGEGGPATDAQLNNPQGVAIDVNGNVYIADGGNGAIRLVSAATKSITTVAGHGQCCDFADNVDAKSVWLQTARVAVDSGGNIYVAEPGWNRVRKVTAATGIISTIAGDGTQGYNGDGIAPTSAQLNGPSSVAVDAAGNVYITDDGNNRIRKISAGQISTVAGTGVQGYTGDGTSATSAQIGCLSDLAVDASAKANIYFTQGCWGTIRRVDGTTGGITRALGGIGGYNSGVAVDAAGATVYMANNLGTVAKFSNGATTTIAGNGTPIGDNGPAIGSQLGQPRGVAIASSDTLYLADSARIRTVSGLLAGLTMISTAAGGAPCCTYNDGSPATNVSIFGSYAVAVDAGGVIYIGEGNRIFKVSNGIIETLAGTASGGYSGDGGPATSASLGAVNGIAINAAGDVLFADGNDNVVRKITASNGTISTIVGNGKPGYTGDLGPAAKAQLNNPTGLALDRAGNLYIADGGNLVIRKVSAVDGTISTFAGNGTCCFSGDGVPATQAQFQNSLAVAVDSLGDVYVADMWNNVIRKVDISTGFITTIAGNGGQGFSGDGFAATGATLSRPTGVAIDSTGRVYVGDTGNNRLRVLTPLTFQPALAVTVSHSGNFSRGQAGATYTIRVSNIGGAATSSPVTVTETVPAGLTLVSMAGSGWDCSAGISCTRNDSLAAGGSYASITATVNVAANASSSVLNLVSVSGGGALTVSSTDSTVISNGQAPALRIAVTQAAAFTQGQSAAAYVIAVLNSAISGPTSGTVTVTDTLPQGVSLVEMVGSGWNCAGSTCSRGDVLAAGASFPVITVSANVASKAVNGVVNHVDVSGGGSVPATGSVVTQISGGPIKITNGSNWTSSLGSFIYSLYAQGGSTTGYTWSLLSGTMPPGLSIRSDVSSFLDQSGGATAAMAGVLTTPGQYNFTLGVRDSLGATTTQAVQFWDVALTPTRPGLLPDAVVGVPYNQTYSMQGNTGMLTFSATGVPPGLSIDATTGLITGSPTTSGDFNPTFQVTDAGNGFVLYRGQSIHVSNMAFQTATTLPSGTIGTPYSQALMVTGGTAPYTVQNFCCLPQGLNWAQSGGTFIISGTPSGGDDYRWFDVQVKDSTGDFIEKKFVLSIAQVPHTLPSFNPPDIQPNYTLGDWADLEIQPGNGAGPYVASIVDDSKLPPGMSMATDPATLNRDQNPAAAHIAGVPSQPGTYTFRLRFTDGSSPAATIEKPVSVKVTPLGMQWLPDATVGLAYNQKVPVYGGTPPYSCSLYNGRLPAGLSLSGYTVSGIPLENGGNYPYVQCSDSSAPALKIIRQIGINGYTPGTFSSRVGFNANNGTTPTTGLGDSFNFGYNAYGGSGSYIWSTSAVPPKTGSGLPSGTSLSSTTGTNTQVLGSIGQPGTSAFLLTVQDASDPTNTFTLQIQIQASRLGLSVPSGSPLNSYVNVGTAIAPSTLTATGTRPGSKVTFSISSGQLPEGLTLSSAGQISGTALTSGRYSYAIQLVETVTAGPTITNQWGYTTDVYPAGVVPPLSLLINGNSSNGGIYNLGAQPLGSADWWLKAQGGTPPYTFSFSPGEAAIPGFRVGTSPDVPPWYSSDQMGSLLGVAVTPGVYSSSLRVTDKAGQTADVPISLAIAAIGISTTTLGEASAGVAYSRQLTGTGGTSPYTFSLENGSALPAGLTLSRGGIISGTPTAAGWTGFRIVIQDSGGNSFTRGYGFTVDQLHFIAPTPANRLLPNAVVNQDYTPVQLAVDGGTPPYAFSLQCCLASGLTLSSNGIISGKPNSTQFLGSFNVQISDSAGHSMYRQFGLSVLPAQVSLLTFNTSLADKVVGSNGVDNNIWLYGGIPPYTITLEPGSSLPPGVELLPVSQFNPDWNPGTYAITGRVSTPGTYNFTLRATDSAGATLTQALALNVRTVEALMTNLPLNGTTAIVNAPYAGYGFVARGGDGNYTWAANGAMPSGMTTASSGKFAGTPLDTGWQCCYPLTVADSAGASYAGTFGFTVNAATPVTLVFNDGNDLGTASTAQIYTHWFGIGTNGASLTAPLTLALASGSSLPPGLLIGSDSSGNPQITGLPTTPGDYFFNLQVTDAAGNMGQKHFHLKVSSLFIANAPQSYNATLGTGAPYSYQFQVFGATGAVTWSVTSGSLPPGLTLNPNTGLLSGTPTAAVATAFTIQAQDSAGNTYQQYVPLNVSNIQITTSQYLPKATNGTPYSVTLAVAPATPASGSYTWSWNYSSSLCGLTLDPAAGTISGTQQYCSGSYSPVVTVSDGTSQAQKRFLLPTGGGSADVPKFYIDSTSEPTGTVGLYYQGYLSLSGGTPPYATPGLVAGTLPPGLSLVDRNVLTGGASPGQFAIAGIPTTAGTYSFTIQSTDAADIQFVRSATIVITPFAVITSSLPNAVYGQPYSAQLSTANCSGCTYAVAESYWYDLPPGLNLSITGLFTGTPTGTGYYYFPVNVSSGGLSALVYLQLDVQSAANQDAIDFGNYSGVQYVPVGKSFNQSYYPNNYSGTPVWTLPSGSLPPGVNFLTGSAVTSFGLDPSEALVAGAPSVPGTFNYTVRVDDSSGNFGIEQQTLIVSELSIAPTSLKPGLAGAPYTQKLSVTGGTAPYTFALYGEGSIPQGMTLSTDGTLSGTPTEDGYFYPILQVQDSNGNPLIQELFLRVLPTSLRSIPIVSRSISLPTGAVGQPYAASLDPPASAGGVAPFTVTLKPGSILPPGLSLIPAATGTPNALAGVPTASGSFTFNVILSDRAGNSQDTVVYLQVSNLSVSPANSALPAGTPGTPYSQTFTASGGVAPYSFSPYFSDMPPGLALNSSGVLSGTPTYTGDFNLSFQVTDASGSSVYVNYTLSVGSTGTTSILAPNPASILINYPPGQATPAPVSLSMDSNPSALPVTLAVAGGAWLKLTPDNASTPVSAQVSVDPTGLAVGIYSGFVAIASPLAVQTPVLVPVVLAIANPSSLSITKTHAGAFKQGMTGAVYTVTVSNAVSASATSTTVTATDTIPAGLTLVSAAGPDWNCSGNTCSRDDALAPGASYPPITVTVNVNANAPAMAINQVSVTTAGSPLATAADPTVVVPTLTAPVLTAPANGATGISTSPTLSWSAVPGAASYDVYLGLTSPPPLVTTTAGITYTPGALAGGSRYYWQIVAKNDDGSVASSLWTFTTQSSGGGGGGGGPVEPPSNCVSSVTPTALAVPGSGGSYSFAVAASAGCQWSVSGLPDWITVSSASGTGSQTLNLQIAPNTTGARSAVLSVGGVAVTINQGATCSCTLNAPGVGLTADGGTGTIGVTAAADCVWAASAPPEWVTIAGTSMGKGNGTVSYQAGANAGAHRSGSITIGGADFTFDQNGGIASSAGTMSHFASGDGWQTEFTLVNLGFGQAQAQVSFFDDLGNPMSAASATGARSRAIPSAKRPDAAQPLPAGTAVPAGVLLQVGVPTSASTAGGSATGSAQLLTDGDIQGYGIVQLKVADGLQEAIVVPETRSASVYFLPFDNTGGHFCGVALSNVSSLRMGVTLTIRDAVTGSVILSDTLSLAANGHTAFLLADRYPATANTVGTLEIESIFGRISALGLRFNANHAFTSVPLLTSSGGQSGTGLSNTGSLAHLSVGGGWKTVYTLANTGTKPAQARLSFFGDDGKPLSLPLHNLVNPAVSDSVASVLDQTLSPGSVTLIESAGSRSQSQTGWARIQTNGSVSGFATFQYQTANGSEQEAVQPVESRAASSYVLPFEGTNGYFSGAALANTSATETEVTVVIRDAATGKVVETEKLSLPAMGHTSFLFKDRFASAANMNGTVEFGTQSGGLIGVWGIRVNSNDAFTTIPALTRQ